jgi:hypothetical protein
MNRQNQWRQNQWHRMNFKKISCIKHLVLSSWLPRCPLVLLLMVRLALSAATCTWRSVWIGKSDMPYSLRSWLLWWVDTTVIQRGFLARSCRRLMVATVSFVFPLSLMAEADSSPKICSEVFACNSYVLDNCPTYGCFWYYYGKELNSVSVLFQNDLYLHAPGISNLVSWVLEVRGKMDFVFLFHCWLFWV